MCPGHCSPLRRQRPSCFWCEGWRNGQAPRPGRKDIRVESVQQIAPGEYEATVVITNELGLHARPAALVAKTAQQFAADVTLSADDRHVDAKSILDILSLAAGKGTALTLRGKGDDAEDCIKTIASLVRVQFQEESA